MKTLHIKKCFISVFLLLALPFAGKTQQKIQIESPEAAAFSKMTLDEQRRIAYQWVNASDAITLPESIIREVEDHYLSQGIDVKISKKYLNWLKPIFNPNLLVRDKINFCHFIRKILSIEEIPLDMVIREQNKLINKTR